MQKDYNSLLKHQNELISLFSSDSEKSSDHALTQFIRKITYCDLNTYSSSYENKNVKMNLILIHDYDNELDQ